MDITTADGTKLSEELLFQATGKTRDERLEELRDRLPIEVNDGDPIDESIKTAVYGNDIAVNDLMKLAPKIQYWSKWISGDVLSLALGKLEERTGTFLWLDSYRATSIAMGIGRDDTLEAMFQVKERRELIMKRHLWPVIVETEKNYSPNHWILMVVDWPGKVIQIYDSMNSAEKYEVYATNIRNYYEKHRGPLSLRVIPVNKANEINGGIECGIYVLQVANELATGEEQCSYEDTRTKWFFDMLTGEEWPAGATTATVDQFMVEFQRVLKLLPAKEKPAEDTTGQPNIFDVMRLRAMTASVRQSGAKPLIMKYADAVESFLDKYSVGRKRKASSTRTSKSIRSISPMSGCSIGEVKGEPTMEVEEIVTEPDILPTLDEPSTSVDQFNIMPKDRAAWSMVTYDEQELARVNVTVDAEVWFRRATSRLPAKYRNDPIFQRKLRKEKRRMSRRLPIRQHTVEPVDQGPRRRQIFNKLVKDGFFTPKEKYTYDKIRSQRVYVTHASYEEGMSGDERCEESEPIVETKRNQRVRCRLCARTFSSEKDGHNHLIAFSADTAFQQADKVTNRYHPRIDSGRIIKKAMLSVLYLQEAESLEGEEDAGEKRKTGDSRDKDAENRGESEDEDDRKDSQKDTELADWSDHELTLQETLDDQAETEALRVQTESKEELQRAFLNWSNYQSQLDSTMDLFEGASQEVYETPAKKGKAKQSDAKVTEHQSPEDRPVEVGEETRPGYNLRSRAS